MDILRAAKREELAHERVKHPQDVSPKQLTEELLLCLSDMACPF